MHLFEQPSPSLKLILISALNMIGRPGGVIYVMYVRGATKRAVGVVEGNRDSEIGHPSSPSILKIKFACC